MAAPRFFVPLDLAPAMIGQTLALPDATAHHAIRVVRLTVGVALTLFTGAGGEYAATLTHIDRRGAAVRIDAFDPVERESPLRVTLAQAIAANDAMDYVIRKATELGVAAIQPLVTARSAPLPDGERGDKRHAHWRHVAVAACEQCGRNRVPDVTTALPLADWLDAWPDGGALLLPDADRGLAALAANTAAAPRALLIGPEGGFATAEIAHALRRAFAAVRLGPRVLRTDTAGVAALAALHVLYGDFK
jgi:16S rRNA (uracil1498-N3)-methyltransferase